MKLLALDTSTEACSCALSIAGEIRFRSVVMPQKHAELILPMADELLAEAGLSPTQLEGVAFGRGPGSFTGLRIACGVAQGIAFGADIPLAPISSLATLAQAAYLDEGHQRVLTAIDARMQEIYWGIYQLDHQGIMQCQGQEQVCSPETIVKPEGNHWHGVGSGWENYADQLYMQLAQKIQSHQALRYPQANAMIPLAFAAFQTGQVVAAEHALPVYLRNKVV